MLFKQRHETEVEELKRSPPPAVSVPRATGLAAGADPSSWSAAVDWSKGGKIRIFRSTLGYPTDEQIEARLLHDGKYLYIRIVEKVETATMASQQ